MRKKLVVVIIFLLMISCAYSEKSFPDGLTGIDESAFEGTNLSGFIRLPDGIQQVGAYAFAKTKVDALIIPASCQVVGRGVLWQNKADYLYLESADTVLEGDPLSFFVFAPTGSNAFDYDDELLYTYPSESLTIVDGVYYYMDDYAHPLCAVNRSALSDTVTVPKFVNGKVVKTLFAFTPMGWDHVDSIRIPAYLEDSWTSSYLFHTPADTYATMSVAAPVTAAGNHVVDDPITWTTQIEGAYGTVTYAWTITSDGKEYSDLTSVPEVTFTPSVEGEYTVTVTATDAVGDSAASAASEPVAVTAGEPQYRALLIGNNYAGTSSELLGCDRDARSMEKMLSRMTGTKYAINTQVNLTAAGIKSAIDSTFAGARSCDVSLFYFCGHGTSSGSLVGTEKTYVTVSMLRSWLDAVPGTKIVIINACYSGILINKSDDAPDAAAFTDAVINGFASKSRAANLIANDYIVMTACAQDQLSYHISVYGSELFAAFTYGLCTGSGVNSQTQAILSSMPADADENGEITLIEAYTTTLELVEYLKSMRDDIEDFNQVAQYYGDDNFVLWIK